VWVAATGQREVPLPRALPRRQLIGVRDTGLAAVIGDLMRELQRTSANTPSAANETTGDADAADVP